MMTNGAHRVVIAMDFDLDKCGKRPLPTTCQVAVHDNKYYASKEKEV